MQIKRMTEENIDEVAFLVAEFRVALKKFKGISSKPDISEGKTELKEYLEAGFPVYGAKIDGKYCGYMVCRIEDPCVWVESIYVLPQYRKKGIASALFEEAEKSAASYGGETVYNYVHPNNDEMIGFLRARGYSVLNLIEIRKPYTGEKLNQKIKVGEQEFDY